MEITNNIAPVQQIRSLAIKLRKGGHGEKADRLDEAARIICEVLPSTEFATGDRVRVRAEAVAVDPELGHYSDTVMTVEHAYAYADSDVTCEHPTEGPCSFASWELEKDLS